MMVLGWEVDLEVCALVERTLGELVAEIFSEIAATEQEKQFVRNAAGAIKECLQRECTVVI